MFDSRLALTNSSLYVPSSNFMPVNFTGFEVYDNFNRTNGPLGTSVSGHVWDVRGKAIGAGIPLPASTNGVIRNGRMISDDYSIVYAVAYMQSTATRVGGVARFYPGVGGVSEGAFGMISGSNVTNTISDSVHVSVWSTGWELDIYDNYVFTTLASGAHTLATNGMPHIIELYIDGNTATLRIDDDIHQAIESRVSTKSGNVVYWENYYATTNALTSIEIDECWAGSSAIRKWHGELYSDINTSSVAVDSGGYYLFNLGWYGATDQEYMRIIPVTDRYWLQSANTGAGTIRGIQLYTSGPNLWAHPNGGVTIGSLTIVPPGLGLTVNGTVNAVGNNQIRVFEDGDTSGTTNRWFREVYTAGTAYLQSSGQLANNGAPIDLNIDGSSKVYASTNAGVGIGTNGCPNGISLYVPGRILARNATLYDLTVDNGGITNSGNYMMTGAGTALIYPIAGGGIGFETDVPGLPKYWNLNPDGSTILPGTLSAAGITNAGTILLTATGQTLLYQLPSGGFALATDIGGSPKYWAFNQDGSTLLPGTLSANGITNAGAYWLTLGGTGLVYSLNHPGGGVGISVNYGGGPNERDWAFETNGITTFPGAITVNQDNGSVSIFNNSTAPGTPSFTIGMGLANLQMNGFGSLDPISTYGLFSQNLFYSTASQTQNSPTVTWSGSGWGTNSATSQPVVFGAYVIPTSGLDTPSGDWVMERIISNTAPVRVFSIRTDSGWTGAGTRLFTDNGKFLPFASIPGLINPTSGYVPYNNAGNPADSWWYYTANGMGTDTNIFLGPGTTNAIFRTNGVDLAYWSATTGIAAFDVIQGNGHKASIGVGNSGQLLLAAEAGAPAQLGDSAGAGVRAYGSLFGPITDQGASLGGSTSHWLNEYLMGNFYLEGFRSGTDYSRLSISQASTNAPVVFDMQTSGTAGYPRPFAFATNGTEVFRIPAGAIWDDSMVPEALVRVGATAPVQANFNGGPGQTLQFENNHDDAVMASVQLSHRYKQGTDVYPHVHWAEVATTGSGTNIVWELQYTWANPGTQVFPGYTTTKMTNSVTGTNWWHSMHAFPAISGSGRTVSAVMVFQLRRLANSATADDYDQNIAFLGFDLHYQVDAPGSDSATSKSF